MNRALRVIASIGIAVAAGWAVHGLYLRHVCNIREMQAERLVMKLFDINDEITARIAARDTVESMNRCIPCAPMDVNQYMIRGAALRMLGRPEEAALDYRRALHVDRRVELFLNLGQAEMEAGHDDAAADALITAVYLVYSYVDDLPQPMQDRVRRAVTPTYLMIQQGRAPHAVLEQLRDRVARDPR